MRRGSPCARVLRRAGMPGGYVWRLARRMREVSTTPRASKYLRWSTLLSHVAAAAAPHAADAATPRATRDTGRAARDERRDSMATTAWRWGRYLHNVIARYESLDFNLGTRSHVVLLLPYDVQFDTLSSLALLPATSSGCIRRIGNFGTRGASSVLCFNHGGRGCLQVRRPGLPDVRAP